MAAIDDFLEQFAEQVQLCRTPSAGSDVVEFEQAQVAADLAQAQQGVEDDHAAAGQALRAHGLDDLAAARLEQFAVNSLLIRRSVRRTTPAPVSPGRSVATSRLSRRSMKRPQPAREPRLGCVALFARDRNFVTLAEILRRAQVTGHEEIEDGPEIEHRIFQRRAGEDQAMPRPDRFHRLRVLGLAILDVLGFVEDHGVELDLAYIARHRGG